LKDSFNITGTKAILENVSNINTLHYLMTSSPLLLIRKLFFVNHTSDIAVFAGPLKTFPTASSEKKRLFTTPNSDFRRRKLH